MAESKIRDENYFQVTGWMLNRLNLKGTALLVYAIIYGFSQDGESSFTGSLQYLCDFTGASRSTVKRTLKDLAEQGYVLKTENLVNGVQFNTYRADLQVAQFGLGESKMNQEGVQNEPTPQCQNEPTPRFKMTPNNKDIDNKELNNKRDKKGSPRRTYGQYDNVFLTDEELAKLKEEFPDWQERIDRLSAYISQSGKKYANHLATIRNWARRDQEQGKPVRRREPVPSWMNPNDIGKYVKNFHDEQRKTVGEDPALAARAEGLRQRLQG